MRDLAAAAENRELIGMAKGILMEREKLDPDRAFDVLRRASQRQNVKVVNIAARMVERFRTQ